MLGIIVNVLAVALGGAAGALCGHRLPEHLKLGLNLIFGVCAMGMGISSVILMENMPAVILAIILGTSVGLLIHLGDRITASGALLQNVMEKHGSVGDSFDISLFVTAIVLFCSSGTGIYGSLDAGMTGNITILLSKSILDFFTAMIFACNLGLATSVIAVPQLLIFSLLFILAKLIYPMTTPVMINDFKACGGFILLATGLRIARIKEFPVADMIPAMILVMPLSAFWVKTIVPLL